MSWSVQRDEGLSADCDPVVVVDWPPFDRIALILFRPGKLEEPRAWIRASNRHSTGCVIWMSVGHQNIAQLCAILLERGLKLFKMECFADTGVNQDPRRSLANKEIRVVSGSRHGTRIVRLKCDWLEHCSHLVRLKPDTTSATPDHQS